jgi:hypothetical protein
MFTIVIFKAEDTERYHSVIFKPSPRPSEYDDIIQRHFSIAHHTSGFDSFESAMQDARDFADNQLHQNKTYHVHEYMCSIPSITTEQIQIYLPVVKGDFV